MNNTEAFVDWVVTVLLPRPNAHISCLLLLSVERGKELQMLVSRKRAVVWGVTALLAGWLVERPALAGEITAELQPSRAAWWLAQSSVEPIADLINTNEPGAPPKFVDRVGKFRVETRERGLVISTDFPEANVWRFDLTTFDGRFDMRKLYVEHGKCAFPDRASLWTRRHAELLGDREKGLTHTGPWEIFGGKWLVPTARVALNGEHVYTSWFDLPSLADQAAGRVYASFALDIPKPGRHAVRVSFEDFEYGTRWRPTGRRGETRPLISRGKNPLRPHDVASIAIGVDERVRALEDIKLKPSLRAKHPRLSRSVPARGLPEQGPLSKADVEKMIIHVDPDRGELWEYCIDAESMASGNDMDAGRKAIGAAHDYDAHVGRLSPEAKAAWDRAFLKRFEGLYTFFVFQRNYHPTGYAQNHSSATVGGLIAGALVWDGPESEEWLRWGVMTCRKRIELYGRDGGLEWMNEGRHYGLRYFQTPLDLIREGTGVDVTAGEPFFQNEWRYALHMAPFFPDPRRPAPRDGEKRKHQIALAAAPPPAGHTPDNTPANHHFDDVDQVFMRSDWGPGALRARLWAGSVFGKEGAAKAKRYNWAHCRTNAGSFVLARGEQEIILEPGNMRTYRKSGTNNNCMVINNTDQWGGGQVWHPRLEADQISQIAFYTDGRLLAAARADLNNAYPPDAKATAVSRCLVQIKPDLFLLFDRVETTGVGKVDWRFHAAFVEPQRPGSRFELFGFDRVSPDVMKGRSATYGEAFKINRDASCQVALLTPGVEGTVGMTDTYYRWSPFSRPQRHLRVVHEGDSPLVLLTAFCPRLDVKTSGNTYQGKLGKVTWAAIVGGGTGGGLESDAYFAVAVEEPGTSHADVFRFGGRRLTFRGVNVKSTTDDVFAEIRNAKVARKVETLAAERSAVER